MIIVSDTTPLRYLIEIDEIYVLEKLFGEVIIPGASWFAGRVLRSSSWGRIEWTGPSGGPRE